MEIMISLQEVSACSLLGIFIELDPTINSDAHLLHVLSCLLLINIFHCMYVLHVLRKSLFS